MKKSLIAILAAASCLAAMGQAKTDAPGIAEQTVSVTAERAFNAAPMRVLPILDKITRLDMVDYYDSGSDHESENTFGGRSRIVEKSDGSLTFTVGESMLYQVFVADPRPGKSVVGIIETVLEPIPDSKVWLYDRFWRELPAPDPSLADWLAKGADRKAAEQLPFIMASWAFDSSAGTLTATQHMAEHYVPADQPAALSMLKPSLAWAWDGRKFKPLK